MEKERFTLSPVSATMIWRILTLGFLFVVWLLGDAKVEGFLLILTLVILVFARWRFDLPAWTVLIDQLLCFLVMPIWNYAWLGMAFPLFEAARKRKLIYLLPIIIIAVVYHLFYVFSVIFLIQSALFGWFISQWNAQQKRLVTEADRERHDRYELEKLKMELLDAHAKSMHMAEVMERNRIARELHDHVGHELTGAVLALQAFEQLWKEDNEKAEVLFSQLSNRLNESVAHLREAVHDMKPEIPGGITRLEEICKSFHFCELKWQYDGDTSKVPAYLWGILEPVVKEALTNVVKHSNADFVLVTLDVSEKIVRLSIHDNGKEHANSYEGTGLRNLRYRAKAVGGSISFSTTNSGFQLVCVLPISK